jgi:hypothetical protein
VDLEIVSALRELRAIPSHSAQDVGLDIDRLLATRKFLREGLLDLGELGAIVDVPVLADDLSDTGLLPRWNPRNKSDSRVQLDIVVALHMQLTAYWHETHCVSTGIRVSELTRDDPHPYRTVATTVSLILNREVAIVAWSSPFTWAAIEVDLPGGDLILRRVTPHIVPMPPALGLSSPDAALELERRLARVFGGVERFLIHPDLAETQKSFGLMQISMSEVDQ